jgi:magnesium-transporting ATPase (P-type)
MAAEDETNFQAKEDAGAFKGPEDPFLFCGSMLARGSCKALVFCLGENTTSGRTEQKLDLS